MKETKEMLPPRCMALSLDVGAGHRMAAEAIGAALEREAPGTVFEIVEGLDHLGPGTGKLAKDLYLGVVKELPDLWGALYAEKTLASWLRPFAELVDDFRSSSLLPRIEAFEPTLVLALHPLTVGLLAALVRQGKIDCPLAVILTDFDGHPAWIARGVDLYLTGTEEVRAELESHGLPTGSARCTGIPLRAPFEAIRSRSARDAEVGLDPTKLTILMLGGGLGLGPLIETARALRSIEGPVQIVLVAGGNEALYDEALDLERNESGLPLHVRGRVEDMWNLLSAADVVVGKTGGLTCAEVMATGKPMVALDPIPGQEEANARALVRAGAAVLAHGPEEAHRHVRRIIEDFAHRAAMERAALAFGRPTAATLAARSLLRLVEDGAGGRLRRKDRGAPDPFSTTAEPFRAFEDMERNAGSLDEAELDEIRSRAESEAALEDLEPPILDVEDEDMVSGPSQVDLAFEGMELDAELEALKRSVQKESPKKKKM